MEEEIVKENVVGENVKLKYVFQRTLFVLVIIVAVLIILILLFLFARNFLIVPSQLTAVSITIDESSVSLNDLTEQFNFVAKKIEGAGIITDFVFVFIDEDGKIASIRQDVLFAENLEEEIIVDYTGFDLGNVQKISIIPILVFEEDELFGNEINIFVSGTGEISIQGPSPVTDSCGDGTCSGDETLDTCPTDCPVTDSCGDGTCSGDETSDTCPTDCPVTDSCGDGTCSGDETSDTCPTDCLASAVCGDEDDVCSEGLTEVCEVGDGYAGTRICSADCSAWGTCVPTEWCGDPLLNGNEVCEINLLNGETCTTQGYQFGDLGCGTNCLSYDVSDCSNSHPIFGDPLVDDGDSSSDDTFLRTWPFDDVSELEIPSDATCTPECPGSTTDHECYDPYYLADRPHWYLIGNSDSGGSNPFIDTAPDGTTIAAQLNNRLGLDTHSRVVVPMSRPNPNIYYVGFDFYIESDSFDNSISNSHQLLSMRSRSLDSCSGPSNQQTNEVTVSYSHVKNYIQLDNWERLVVKHDVPAGVVEVFYNGDVIKTYSTSFSPTQESHQFQLRSRDNDSHGAIWFNNLAVGTDYNEVLNYQG